ncbi:MAG: Sua5/YciO/YrdC/YwlC family protein [Edaphobacter sp.]|nr:Sua5/YciO/YrdC/YwlC family protein [Edaphobacter sp.]
MKTEYLDARTTQSATESIPKAAQILRAGGTVAFPTETVYGLGANALDPAAVAKIFAAKDRPDWDPLIVHITDRKMLEQVARVTPKAERLIEAFWPGPMTLLLPRTANISDAVTAARPLVGVRMPAHPVAAALIHEAGVPVAAPSANRFGRTSPTTAQHVLEDLNHRIDAILDGGPTTVGVESTVLDPGEAGEPMLIYRPGAITPAMLEAVAGEVSIFQSTGNPATPQSLPSPGVGIRHYAPRAKLLLVTTESEFASRVEQLTKDGERVGVMLPQGWPAKGATEVFQWASWNDGKTLAQRLFAGLRELDAHNVTTIVCPLPEAEGVGLAIRDRLQKAARSK